MDFRSTPLTSEEISAFINDHLPYRVKVLDNVKQYPNQLSIDPNWPSFYESAQIMCRMFIEFFGLGIDNSNPPKLKEVQGYFSQGNKSYEVKIRDLNVDFVRLQDLTQIERDILAHAYQAGSRATAHLTYGHPFTADPKKVIEASKIIRKLVKSKLGI